MLVAARTRIVRLFYLLLLLHSCSASCPPEEEVTPKCFCYDTDHGGTLSCRNIFDQMELIAPVEATVKHNMLGLIITNSTLRFLPRDLFRETNYREIRLINTQLLSLSDDDVAFDGLEDHLTEIRATATHYVSQWDFDQLRNLKKLKIIDVNSVVVDSIAEDLPEFPELTIFGLTKAELSHISENALAKCPRLTILALDSNRLNVMKRSMLPNPANHLEVINLQHNQLMVLPDDFFTNMPSLTDVYLNHNRFISLEENAFRGIFNSIKTFTMNGNPLKCDCRLFWIMRSRIPMSLSIICAAPDEDFGKDIRDLSFEKCRIG